MTAPSAATRRSPDPRTRMRLSAKDSLGTVLVAGTLATLFVHGSEEHQAKHLPEIVDAGGAVTSAGTASTTAFVDFHLLPMDDTGMLRRQVVVVRNGFVERIGPVGVVEVPQGALVIEGGGTRFLLPGLVDAHVHLPDAREDVLPLFLANGITTVFNLQGDSRHLSLRDRSRDPAFRGPTIYTAGPFVSEAHITASGGVDRVIDAHLDAGFDFVKLHGSITEDRYDALTAAARRNDIAVIGHAPRSLPFSALVEHGQVGVAHAEELIYTALPSLDRGGIDEVARALAEAGMWVTPTLTTFESITAQWASPEALRERLERPEARYLPGHLREKWAGSAVYSMRPSAERPRIEAMNDFHAPLVRGLHEAGVGLLTGTDASVVGLVPGFSLHDELAALTEAGLSPEDVLHAATSNAGSFVRDHVDPTARFGVISIGARADLIAVASDPTADLGVLRRPLGVMARGRWHDRDELRRWLESAAGPRVAEQPTR